MKLKDLIEGIPGCACRGNLEVEVKGIASDSREVKEGDLFVALPGEKYNGADFISEALDRKAAGLVVKEFFTASGNHLPQVKVEDPRLALGLLSNEFYRHPSRRLKIIGVTGTNGKTTVAFLSRAILEASGRRAGLLGTVVYQLGERSLPSDLTTPAPPRLQGLLQEMKKAGCTHAVMEVSSHALRQERVAGIEFQAAVFTNLSREHLDYHRTWEDYRDAKAKIFRELHRGERDPKEKRAILNRDDPNALGLQRDVKTPVLTYGLSPEADLWASRLRLSETGSAFDLNHAGERFPAEITLLGRHNVYNALAAAGVGLAEGVGLETIVQALRAFTGIPGRLERVEAGQPFAVLVDYAHTPDALANALRAVREIFRGRVIVVFGCGGDRDRGKRPLMGAAAEASADVVIVTSDNPRSEAPEAIIGEILAGIPRMRDEVTVIVDRREAIGRAVALARRGDAVLIAGKGHERQQIFRDRIVPFDDREVARAWLLQGSTDP